MSDPKLRQAIALEAARLMYERTESEYFTAKRKAARRLCRGSLKPEDLPSNAEIRDQIQLFARLHEGDKRTKHLREMRLEALRMMRILRPFRPRLIGSVMTGHVRKGSDVDLHVFCDSPRSYISRAASSAISWRSLALAILSGAVIKPIDAARGCAHYSSTPFTHTPGNRGPGTSCAGARSRPASSRRSCCF